MILNTSQAKEKLNVGDKTLRNLVQEGKIKPVNEAIEGKRFHMRFDSRDVNLLAAKLKSGEIKIKHRMPLRSNGAIQHTASDGVLTRLHRIESEVKELVSKIDKLITIWS